MRSLFVVFRLAGWACLSTAALAEEVDQSFLGNFGAAAFIYNGLEQAQTFTAGASGYLSRVDLQVIKFDPSLSQDSSLFTQPLTLSIRGMGPTGPILGTFNIAPAQVPWVLTPGVVSLDVSSAGVRLAPGVQLALVLSSTLPATSPVQAAYGFAYAPEGGYVGGTAWTKFQGYPWFSQDPDDFGFQTYVTPVPEPTTLTFLGLGSLALATARRRRQDRYITV